MEPSKQKEEYQELESPTTPGEFFFIVIAYSFLLVVSFSPIAGGGSGVSASPSRQTH